MINIKFYLIFVGLVLGLQSCRTINVSAILGLSLPDDNTLELNFRNNKQEFERLKNLFQEDNQFFSIYLYSTNFYYSNEGDRIFLPPARFQEYKQLMKKNNVTEGIYRHSEYPDSVFFEAASIEVGKLDKYQTCIDEKGYVFSENELSHALDSLDYPDRVEKGIAFKKIDNNWYVYYRKTIGKPE